MWTYCNALKTPAYISLRFMLSKQRMPKHFMHFEGISTLQWIPFIIKSEKFSCIFLLPLFFVFRFSFLVFVYVAKIKLIFGSNSLNKTNSFSKFAHLSSIGNKEIVFFLVFCNLFLVTKIVQWVWICLSKSFRIRVFCLFKSLCM